MFEISMLTLWEKSFLPLIYSGIVVRMTSLPSLFAMNTRYGNQVVADELNSLYGNSRAKGFGSEV